MAGGTINLLDRAKHAAANQLKGLKSVDAWQLNRERKMRPSVPPPPSTPPVDEDLVEQARPGHGIPSQDPDPAAQFPQEPEEAQREVQSMLTGGGVVAGVATGATIGGVVAGPAGAVVGAALGAVTGAVGGAAAGAAVNPEKPASDDDASAENARPKIDDSGDSA